MDSIREKILQALTSKLTELEQVNSTRVFRSRKSALSGGDPAIIVQPVSEEVEALMSGLAERRLTVSVRVIARGEVPDQVADPIVAEAHAKLTADTRLNGLTVDISELGSEWQIEEAELPSCEVAMSYVVTYRTELDDLMLSA
jgi:hypothetical protein